MKKLSVLVVLFTLVLSANAVTNVYWFRVDPVTSNEVASAFTPYTPKLWVGSGNVQRYYIIVTSNQYEAGWAALPQAVKDAGKVAAEAYRDDKWGNYDKWGPDKISIIDVMREEINILRAAQGLTPYTKGEWKQKLKDKKPKK